MGSCLRLQVKATGKADDLQTALGAWGGGEGGGAAQGGSDSGRIAAGRDATASGGAVETAEGNSGASSPSLAGSGTRT